MPKPKPSIAAISRRNKVRGLIRDGAPGRPRVLLLQGPVGPFFRHLQSELNSQGYEAWRATFNAGDRLFSGHDRNLSYAGNAAGYRRWLSRTLEVNRFELVILFGSSRPIHRIARNVCRQLSIPVLALEEGYVRPGFITAEEGGNNATSPIANKLPTEDELTNLSDPVAAASARSSFGQMALYAMGYFITHGLLSGPSERRLYHKRGRTRLVREALLWMRNGYRKYTDLARNYGCQEKLLEAHDGNYYFVPLQVSDDGQLHTRSAKGWTNEKLIERLTASFAANAPSDTRLVFKLHPIDRGHHDHSSLIEATAKRHGVSDRIDVLTSGSVGLMVRHCKAMITINSSAGLSAIFHGAPLGVLGDAIYTHPDLVERLRSEDKLASFWKTTRRAEPELRRDYLRWLRANTLQPGDFYRPVDAQNSCQQLIASCIGPRLPQPRPQPISIGTRSDFASWGDRTGLDRSSLFEGEIVGSVSGRRRFI